MTTTQKSFGSLKGFFTLLFLFQLVFGFGQEERQTNLNATNTDDQSNVYSANDGSLKFKNSVSFRYCSIFSNMAKVKD